MNVELNQTDLLFPPNRRVVAEARALEVSLAGAQEIDGLLAPREGLLLYVLARRAAPTGNVVEIGSYKGRSTWFLARALSDSDSRFRVVAIDPHVEGTEAAFRSTIERSGVADYVDVRVQPAHDAATAFDEPIGLLWIDGDHSYDAVRLDFEDWFPRLAEGGWIAFHDTASIWWGPTKLARELLSARSDLENVGLIGSILYAQKARSRLRNRARAWLARVAFELVTANWRVRMHGHIQRASGER